MPCFYFFLFLTFLLQLFVSLCLTFYRSLFQQILFSHLILTFLSCSNPNLHCHPLNLIPLLPLCLFSFLSLPFLPSLQVWFQNRRMKDKRQRHSLPWPHPLVDPLGALLMGRVSPSSSLPYPFIPPHHPHLPLHHHYPLALSSPASSAHSRYSTPMRTLDALRLSQYHNRPGGLPPTTAAFYPSSSIVHHPASCPCPLCLHWGPEQLFKARGEALGLGQPRSPKANIQPAGLERREEMV